MKLLRFAFVLFALWTVAIFLRLCHVVSWPWAAVLAPSRWIGWGLVILGSVCLVIVLVSRCGEVIRRRHRAREVADYKRGMDNGLLHMARRGCPVDLAEFNRLKHLHDKS